MSFRNSIATKNFAVLGLKPCVCGQLETPVRAVGNVETWLAELLKEQQKSLHGVIRHAATAIVDPEFVLTTFISEQLAQVMLTFIGCHANTESYT